MCYKHLTEEDYEILNEEYYKFGKLPPYEEFCWKMFCMQFLSLLIVFVLPTNILIKFPFLENFTNCMSLIFDNINLYADVSKIPGLTKFYISYSWLILIIFCFWHIYKIYYLAKIARKYFGTCEFKNNAILPKKFLPLFENKNKSFKNFIFNVFITIFFIWCIFNLIQGNAINTSLGNWMSCSKFGLFVYAILQNLGIYALFFISTIIFIVKINLKRLNDKI